MGSAEAQATPAAGPAEPGGFTYHNLTISHQKPLASNNYAKVELTGDLATAQPPHTFSNHYLVMPERYSDR